MADHQRSVVGNGHRSRHGCGYCDSEDGFASYGMLSESMTVQAYQDLLDIGWRRSGCYLYKPDLPHMCCPLYTIRLEASQFRPNKSQKKTLRKLENYLNGGALSSVYASRPSDIPEGQRRQPTDRWMLMQLALKTMVKLWMKEHNLPEITVPIDCKPILAKQRTQLSSETFISSPMCFPLFHRLKSLRMDADVDGSSVDALAEIVCTFFNDRKEVLLDNDLNESGRMQWSIIIKNVTASPLKGHINFAVTEGMTFDEASMTELTSQVTSINQLSLLSSPEDIDLMDAESHGSTQPTEWPSEQTNTFCRPLNRKRSLEITTVPNNFIQEEYELYRKYQMIIHNDDPWHCTPRQYQNFLVNTPLMRVQSREALCPQFGSFHMQYRIDGQLVAVGVVDILPRCLSSVYLFWDPDFASLSLGKISALKEIERIQTALTQCPELKYYYMGYYIHSCPKMRYKGDYAPSELLSPETYLWVKLTGDIRAALDAEAYVKLSAIEGSECRENEVESRSINGSIRSQSVVVSGHALSLGVYMDTWKDKEGQNGIIGMFGSDRRKHIHRFLEDVTRKMTEWRVNVRNVADQLMYKLADFPAYL